MPAKAAKPENDLTFESAVERLESLVEAMESDKLPLTELLVRYEEGNKLVRFCQEQLATAEKRIEIITRNAKGEPRVEPFEPEKAAAAPTQTKPAPEEDVSLF